MKDTEAFLANGGICEVARVTGYLYTLLLEAQRLNFNGTTKLWKPDI